jgi:hypothetical protein
MGDPHRGEPRPTTQIEWTALFGRHLSGFLGSTPGRSPKRLDEISILLAFAKPVFRIEPAQE